MTEVFEVNSADGRVQELLEAVITVGGDLELSALLDRIVEAAVVLVDCRYGALGVIGEAPGVGGDDAPGQLVEFHTRGMSEQDQQRIGHQPKGEGILGLLVSDPRPLRLADLSAHPHSIGFPAGHPPMKSFLGVPIRVRGEVYGNLYLTGKNSGEAFTAADEALLITLAGAAGVAVGNARLYEEAKRSAQWQRASAEITRLLLAGSDSGEVLDVVAARAREIADADLAVIGFADEAGLIVVEVASGEGAKLLLGTPLPLPEPALSVPFAGVSQPAAVLAVANTTRSRKFGQQTVRQVQSFAAQAALALELAEARTDAERILIFEDRDRIARDLHDSVIQRLFAAGMRLESAARIAGNGDAQRRIRGIVDDLDDTIRDIRSTIYSLQTLERNDSVGLGARIVGLAEQLSSVLGSMPSVAIDSALDSRVPETIGDDLIAVVRESLSNVARHAHASEVDIRIEISETDLLLRIRDNGRGFAAGATDLRRSGLLNLANRAVGHGGSFLVRSDEGRPLGGVEDPTDDKDWTTEVCWKVPIVGS